MASYMIKVPISPCITKDVVRTISTYHFKEIKSPYSYIQLPVRARVSAHC